MASMFARQSPVKTKITHLLRSFDNYRSHGKLPFDVSSVPTFFRGERPEMTWMLDVNRSSRVQAVDLLALFRTWSNSGFVGFHRGYA